MNEQLISWIQVLTIILSIVIPLGAFMKWVLNEVRQSLRDFEFRISKELNEIKTDIKEVKTEVSQYKDRMTKLEGRFEERGYWESRIYHQKEYDDLHFHHKEDKEKKPTS